MPDRNGYIGRAPSDSSVQVARQSFTASGITTDFTFSSGYTPGYFDIYINGVKMIEGSDYASSDGSTFSILNGGASDGDVLEAVAYKAFNAATVTNASDLTVSGNLTVNGSATFAGAGTSVSFATTAFNLSGSPDITVRNITGVAATFSGAVSYEDVVNVDSVGIITARSGVSIADSIFHTGDTNTAIRFPAADTFTVETAGSEALRVDSSGRLLLGTTTEGAALADNFTVADSGDCGITIRSGTSNYGSIYFSDATSGADEYRGQIEYNHNTDILRLYSGGTAVLRIDPGKLDVIGHTETDTLNASGIITASSFRGDGSQLTNIISGVEVKNDGTSVGTGITAINFSTNVTATASGGIATVTASGGGGGGGSEGPSSVMMGMIF